MNVDMIVQNVAEDGTTDMTFTVGKADLPHAQASLEAVRGTIGYAEISTDMDVAKTFRGGRGDAQPCRRGGDDVQNVGGARDQHPGDLHQRDQGERADRGRNIPSWRCGRCTRRTASMPPEVSRKRFLFSNRKQKTPFYLGDEKRHWPRHRSKFQKLFFQRFLLMLVSPAEETFEALQTRGTAFLGTRACHHGRGDELGERKASGGRHFQCRRVLE